MTSQSADYDIAIIGGGPAGSAAATFLSREGLKCVVLERDKFPRAHVGESLVPATTPLLKELGVLELLALTIMRNQDHLYGSIDEPELKIIDFYFLQVEKEASERLL